ncbi:SixA phosphatase family protein [Wenxinia marina]|uniref:Phosphohistidine phosphatase SixA n=1 Tax=Wenxinia marina DSM 24838 TaxID=1123501 RepID=A0A0D0PHC3_9RHOB|nr:histidine phosphatase family protein [Wenxinia marina]KIQ70721.1 Phosphohistidine phosphatase SixA [Wenxinia marina DSM 24838]GGL51125.1 phosphoglycerate mutase [Wenxinia marina]
MSLRLVLIRHAKSAWGQRGLADRDRPLDDRGRRAAPRIGGWIAGRAAPDEALVSDALRTRQTWELIAAKMPAPAKAWLLPDLYLAEADEMLRVLHGASGRVVAMVGHNDGIAQFAAALAAAPPDHRRFADYPTGATTILDFDASRWGDVGYGAGTVTDFVVPRDLE